MSRPVWIDPAQSRLGFYYITLVFLALVFLFIRRLMHSPTGQCCWQSARMRNEAIGYNTLYFKLIVIVIAEMIAGSAGMFHVLMKKRSGQIFLVPTLPSIHCS